MNADMQIWMAEQQTQAAVIRDRVGLWQDGYRAGWQDGLAWADRTQARQTAQTAQTEDTADTDRQDNRTERVE